MTGPSARLARLLPAACVCLTALHIPFAPAQTSQPDVQAGTELVDLSIFRASRTWKALQIAPPDDDRLSRFVADVMTTSPNPAAQKDARYPMIPILLDRCVDIPRQGELTPDQQQRAARVIRALERLFPERGFATDASEPADVRRQLDRVTDWFDTLTQDDRQLAKLIFTTDDGPFFGQPIDPAVLDGLRILDAQAIPESDGRLVLYHDVGAQEPIIAATFHGSDATPVSARRLSAAPLGKINKAEFAKDPEGRFVRVGRYGYKCNMRAEWDFGRKFMHLYLASSLEIRFYFISW